MRHAVESGLIQFVGASTDQGFSALGAIAILFHLPALVSTLWPICEDTAVQYESPRAPSQPASRIGA